MSTEEIVPASSAPQNPSPPAENPSTTALPSESAPAPTEEKQKPAFSPIRKIARPAKARASMPGSSKKAAKGGQGSKSFSPGDIVLARLKGFPAWPGRVTDPDSAPAEVLRNRTSTKPYIYCVEFFPQGDFAWINANEIKSLSRSDIEAYLSEPHRKAQSSLREAYMTAHDPTEWDDAQAVYRKEKEDEAAKAKEGYDELEEDDDAPSGGKRKRGAEKKTKSKKKAKQPTKKSAAEVESEEDAPKAKKASATSKPAATKAPDSKPADDDPLASNPECIKVKDWRHRLQRGFLGKGMPDPKEMENYDEIFKTIEGYKNMTIEALSYSKIGKVMKKIAQLETIPRNDEFKFTNRASKLMHTWQSFIDSKGGDTNGIQAANGNAPASTSAAPAEAPSAAADSGAPTGSPPAPVPAKEDVDMQGTKPVENSAPALADSAPQASTKADNQTSAPAAPPADVPEKIEPAMLDNPIYPPVNGQ